MSDEQSVAVRMPHLVEMLQRLKGQAEIVGTGMGSQDAAFSIMESILSAEDEESAFAAALAGTTASRDFTNRPFRLRVQDIEVRMSSYVERNSLPFFLLMRVTTLDTQEPVVINCGAYSTVAIIDKLVQLGSFDRWESEGGMPLQFVSRPTAAGYNVVILQPFRVPQASGKRGSR